MCCCQETPSINSTVNLHDSKIWTHFLLRYANGACDRTTGPPPATSFVQGTIDARYKRYSALDDDGICRVGEKLNDQYIMINREIPVEDRDSSISGHGRGARSGRVRLTSNDIGGSTVYKSQPCVYKAPASSVVDRVLLTANDTDQFLVKVMVRQCRRPEVGDKSTQSMIIESGAMGLDNGLHVDLQVATGRRVCAVQLCHKKTCHFQMRASVLT